MRHDDSVAVDAAGQETILDDGLPVQFAHQPKADHNEQQGNSKTGQACGLAVRTLLIVVGQKNQPMDSGHGLKAPRTSPAPHSIVGIGAHKASATGTNGCAYRPAWRLGNQRGMLCWRFWRRKRQDE